MIQEDEIQIDKGNRMGYHPDFHHNHGKPFTESDLEYLCKFYEYDSARAIGFALGKTDKTIQKKVSQLRVAGLFDYYKNLNKHW